MKQPSHKAEQSSSTDTPFAKHNFVGMVQLCESICIPLRYIGEYVRSSNEAKVLCECTLLANKLKVIWPQLSLNMSTFQFTHKRVENISNPNCIESVMFCSPFQTPLDALLRSCSEEQRYSIMRLCGKFATIVQRLITLRHTLKHFADLNASIASELLLQQCTKLATQKSVLSQMEKLIVHRIDWLVDGCPQGYDLDMRTWEEVIENKPATLPEESTKRSLSEKSEEDDDQIESETEEQPSKKHKSQNM
jgi:hypothetical protein